MNVKELADNVICAVKEHVARAIAPLVERLAQLESRPAPQDGKSVTIDDVRPMVQELVAGIPEPKDGTSVTLDDVRPMIEAHLKAIPAPKDGTSVTIEDLRPMIDAFLTSIPAPKDGDPGKSVTLDDVRGYLDTEVATWALSFERRAQDILQRAIDRIPTPKDGRDGLAVEDFDATIEGRTITLTVTRGEFTRSRALKIPAVLDAGIFREGTTYEKGDGVTFGGSFWIAQKDAPEGKPGTNGDFRLAVKKGRDGADR